MHMCSLCTCSISETLQCPSQQVHYILYMINSPTSTPSPFIPATRTLDRPIFFMASWPSTYLTGKQNNTLYSSGQKLNVYSTVKTMHGNWHVKKQIDVFFFSSCTSWKYESIISYAYYRLMSFQFTTTCIKWKKYMYLFVFSLKRSSLNWETVDTSMNSRVRHIKDDILYVFDAVPDVQCTCLLSNNTHQGSIQWGGGAVGKLLPSFPPKISSSPLCTLVIVLQLWLCGLIASPA